MNQLKHFIKTDNLSKARRVKVFTDEEIRETQEAALHPFNGYPAKHLSKQEAIEHLRTEWDYVKRYGRG